MLTPFKTVTELVNSQTLTNVFEDIPNIELFGGSEMLWEEFIYRYSNFYVYKPEQAKAAVTRLFIVNKYKYSTLLETAVDVDPLLEVNLTSIKTGNRKDVNTSNGDTTRTGGYTDTGTDTKTLDTQTTTSDTFEKNKNTTVSETGKNTLTVDRTKDGEDTRTDDLQTAVSEENNSYTDTTNRSDYVSEDLTLKPVYSETLSHKQDTDPHTTDTANTGTVKTETLLIDSGTETTDTTRTTNNTGKDTDTRNATVADTGTETLDKNLNRVYNNLKDVNTSSENNNTEYTEQSTQKGHKSNPFDLLNKARLTAKFSVIDIILKDVKKLILFL